MSEPRMITVAWRLLREDSSEAAELRAAGARLRFEDMPATEDETIACCRDAWAMLGMGSFSRRVFAALPALRYIQWPIIGYDRVDVAAATEAGVAVANNPAFCREEVSDHAAMLILAAARRLPSQVHRLDTAGWDMLTGYAAMGDTPRVNGATLGFVGFGAIARMTAHKFANFGMTYLAYDPYLPADIIRQHGAEPVSLDELCRRSDILTMHALLNEETRGMLRAEHFRQMKPTAWVVNTSRGATIHEASLIQALREGWIGGACLDVVEKEPAAPDNPLLTMPN
ncbi:MAG: C-terminal binding protein, partial [Chloroflexi bacterium]|nr:C-terminal binding protein [Chloroflexota bacterium]